MKMVLTTEESKQWNWNYKASNENGFSNWRKASNVELKSKQWKWF